MPSFIFSKLSNPNDIFDEGTSTKSNTNKKWHKIINDEIVKYGIIVASCNNAAVENISKELPEFDDKMGEENIEYFKNYDNRYFIKKDESNKENNINDKQWGLISVPLGNKKNIMNFLFNNANSLNWIVNIELKNPEKKKIWNFEECKEKFKNQLEIVLKDRNQLIEVSNKFKENARKINEIDNALNKIHTYQNLQNFINVKKKEVNNFKRESKIGIRKFSNLIIYLSYLYY
ncbi:hypothetical protein PR246_00270 [Metamycoplasma hyosynoviae]|uniref:hypothetical protein n=1 Tax=Metamycoplasma hyosynoviae TaxID=29559 RepID=UPI002359FE0F|nr:hypothetical protein [Metamycoplasma hyosynoviae]MDC8918135.1 hypothetical protein [Metamycoplasma hyosynoviae]